jgi:hypothetical protein
MPQISVTAEGGGHRCPLEPLTARYGYLGSWRNPVVTEPANIDSHTELSFNRRVSAQSGGIWQEPVE